MADDTEWLKLPTDDKCVHKAWKARVAGYEEATKLFQTQTDEKSPEFSKYLGLVKKFVTDSNAIAQEKALDAVLAFVENAGHAGKTCGEVVSGVIAKCLNSSRTKTREKGLEIIMLYVEIDKPEPVQEELLKGLENKQPKIVTGCIQALREALAGFGTKVIKVKPVVKVLPKLLEDRDKNVREETKLLIIEIYRWIGAAIKPQMTHYKPVQVQELEAEFEKLGNERAVQTRFMRSQQDLRAQMEEKAAAATVDGAGDADGGAAPVEDVDPYELMDPVDILSLLPKDFYEKIEAKKWQERREALEALQKLAETPKLQSGEYGALVRVVLKVIGKDSNVMLVTLAAKCLAGLASGLRKRFSQFAANSIQTILEKFKEKKATVVAALREAIDACYMATTLDPICEDILESLGNKNPAIKAETSLFLSRCFAKATTATLPKKLLKAFCAELCKKINDTAPEVREAAFTALGVAMKVVGEKPLTPFLADVDSIKLGKIKEHCENAVLLNARGEPRSGGASAAPAPKSSEPAKEPSQAKAAQKQPAKASAAKSGKSSNSKGSASGATKKKGGKKEKKVAGEEVQENILADEVVEDKAAALLPAETITQLVSSNWKERLAAMEKFTQVVNGMSRDEIPAQVFVRTICKKPGLKDTNFQVLKIKLELVAFLAKNSSFSKRSASFCLAELVDKTGDVKNGKVAQETLSCIAEATSLEFVAAEVVHLAFEQKNPKNQAECLNWLATAVKEFGFKISVKPMIENIKKAFGATNPVVRAAALNLLSTLYLYMGATLRVFFDGEKAALLQQIDSEFEKLKGEKPPEPVRGLTKGGGGVGEEEDDEEEVQEAPSMVDLIPRTDISDKITEELLTGMSDKAWKIRAEGLQKVVSILNEAKFVSANIGQLPEALKTRLGDSNKILVNTTLGICQSLGTALGPHCKGHVRVVGPGMVTCMGDSKPQVRASAHNAMNIWAENCSLLPFVEAEVFSDALKLENPTLRAELLGWLSEKLPPHKQLPVELRACVPHVLACLEDRNGEVRKKAQESLVPFMIHTGYDSFQKATSKLKPASKDQIISIIEKARANVPAKPSKKAAKKPAPVAAAPPPKQEVRDEDDEEVESIISAACKSTPAGKGKSKGVVSKAKAPPPSGKKKKEEEDSTPGIVTNVSKEQRLKEEKALKTLKWNFSEPRAEFLEQLKLQMERNFNKAVMAQLFHADFKQHIKAIESLMKLLENNLDGTAANLDLLLRWMTLRFFDTNPSMLNKALEYLIILFTALAEMDYRMTDSEAVSFIPYLVNKVGDPKDNVRRDVRTIFKQICKVYPASKMFSFVIDGLKAKNAKLRTECLEELGCLIECYGVNVCQPSPAQALKLIAQQIGDRDNCVRSAALNSLVSAHHILGEQTYKYIGRLKDKDQSLLEERIKRSAKNKPPPTPQSAQQSKSNKDRLKSGAPSTDKANNGNVRNPKSAPTPSRPTKKIEFSLEVEEVDSKEVDLHLADLDYISNILAEKVELPKVELPKTNGSRPCSPSTFVDLLTNDASSAIGLVISDIASTDTLSSIQALAQIDQVLKDKEKQEVMVNHIDKLLLTLSMQLKMVYSKHMADEMTLKEDVMKLYRCLLGTLLDVFKHKKLGRQASGDILKDLLSNLVANMLVKKLETLEGGPQVIKSVNVAIVKILRNSDPTTVIGALIKLLHECLGSETCSTSFIGMITKCLWKVIRLMPEFISEVNLDRFLLDAHTFLKAYPSSYLMERYDIQYRTFRTIIHTAYTLVGSKLLDHTSLISQADSEVITYIKSLANRNDVQSASNNSHNISMNAWAESTTAPKESSRQVLESNNEILLEILSKISSEEKSEEGLNDLYDFMKKHPEVDRDSFLQKYSQSFQHHVQKVLKVLEQDKEGSPVLREFSPNPVCGSMVNRTENKLMKGSDEKVLEDSPWLPISDAALKTAISYRQKLRQLRSQCGLSQACEGLDALIEFKNTCGEADLSSFLQKSAESFSIFVEGDLKTGQPGGENKHRPGNLLKESNSLSVIASEKNTAVFYQEKLHKLRRKCGLDQKCEQQENKEPQEPSPSIPKKISPVKSVPVVKPPEPKAEESEGTVESVRLTSVNMLELKKRLDRIKKMAKH